MVIKKSLCTWWFYCNRQVYRDFLITLFIKSRAYTYTLLMTNKCSFSKTPEQCAISVFLNKPLANTFTKVTDWCGGICLLSVRLTCFPIELFLVNLGLFTLLLNLRLLSNGVLSLLLQKPPSKLSENLHNNLDNDQLDTHLLCFKIRLL